MQSSPFMHLHAHSHYSVVDAMTSVSTLVSKAAKLGQPGMALTDHGVVSGIYQLYRACKQEGILPFPGLEAYLVGDTADKTAKRYHLTLIAYTTEGVRNLNALSSLAHQHFYRKPLLSPRLIESMPRDGIAALSGCFFGWIQQAFVDNDEAVDQIKLAERRAKRLASWFSPTYIELQAHGLDDDWKMLASLMNVAHKTGLRPIITNDCHYCDKAQQDLHSLMKTLVYGGDPGDVTFPGDSYHLASAAWMQNHYERRYWDECQDSYTELIDMNKVSLPFLDSYQYYLPKMTTKQSSDSVLLMHCRLALGKRKLSTKYDARLLNELDVIEATGFADYFLFVQDYCQEAKRRGIVCEVRGSANASVVCWLLGITGIDPIKGDLDFDRFLTVDRERPPDIDLDVEDERRGELIDYINGIVPLVQIGNYSRLGYDMNDKGSILVTYLAAMRRRHGPDEFKDQFGHITRMQDLEPELRTQLYRLGDMKVLRGVSAHAAGYVMDTVEHPVADWMPTMYIASSKSTVTQMTMDDVEDAGFVKIDMLGAKVLTIIRDVCQQIGEDPLDLSWIPVNDSGTYAFLRKGLVDTGVFQFGAYTSARGCREMKVRNLEDLTLVNALYRPATRDGGFTAQYLRRREGRPYKKLHPLVDKHLDRTLGVAVYQEQVLAILRDLGFTVQERTKLLKAVKASNDKVAKAVIEFENARKRFTALCGKVGMDDEAIHTVWGMVEGYSNYGFNRAHALAYALRGYRTAYLRVHHTLEWMTALLTMWSGTPTEAVYLREARRSDIRILPADVNHSASRWTIDHKRQALRRPLASIKGVGPIAVDEIAAKQPFIDYQDLLARCDARKVTGGKKPNEPNGVIRKLIDAGAMRSIQDSLPGVST